MQKPDCVTPAKQAFERAWHHLTPSGSGYPDSAAFVKQVWKGDFSLLLCEKDEPTIAKLKSWCEGIGKLKRCTSRPELHEGDWRKRFEQPRGLPSPDDVGLPPESLTLLSFDPFMYDRRHERFEPGSADLYRRDIELVGKQLKILKGPILIQLSTYSTRDGNGKIDVRREINGVLCGYEFQPAVRVNVGDQKMMSLVYARNVSWSAKLEKLPECFAKWLRQV